jgi:hypothetical protein
MLAVVPADREDSKGRQCNIVVSGLALKPGVNYINLFLYLCESNLKVKPYAVRAGCRRLGWPQSGKIQPLLICLNKAESANDLLVAAKRLRRSVDAEVRRKVCFNPDMTPGEAHAA